MDTRNHEWVWCAFTRYKVRRDARRFLLTEDMMITTGIRAAVSTLSVASTLVLAACAGGPSPATGYDAVATSEHRVAIRFDNEAQSWVDVYLVGQTREWRLGRVAPGAHTTLWVPESAVSSTSGFVRLAVLAGAPPSAQAARDPRAIFTVAQPSSDLLSQQWKFSQRQSATPEIFGSPLEVGRP